MKEVARNQQLFAFGPDVTTVAVAADTWGCLRRWWKGPRLGNGTAHRHLQLVDSSVLSLHVPATWSFAAGLL